MKPTRKCKKNDSISKQWLYLIYQKNSGLQRPSFPHKKRKWLYKIEIFWLFLKCLEAPILYLCCFACNSRRSKTISLNQNCLKVGQKKQCTKKLFTRAMLNYPTLNVESLKTWAGQKFQSKPPHCQSTYALLRTNTSVYRDQTLLSPTRPVKDFPSIAGP